MTVEPTWTSTAVAIAAILLVGVFAVVVVWQIFATARAKMSVEREEAYKKLAEDSAQAQRLVAEGLTKNTAELSLLRQHTAELERMLKEVG
jgi:hypothetical protein